MPHDEATTARTAREMPYYHRRAPTVAATVALAAVPVVAMWAATHATMAVVAVTTTTVLLAARTGDVREA